MKALSTVYGAYVASLMIFLLMMSFWATLSTMSNEVSNNIDELTKKLEVLANKPLMKIKLMNNTLYLEIHAYKPFKIAYMIIEYLNGTIIFKKIDEIVHNTTILKVIDRYDGSPVKVGIILDNGIVLYYDPQTNDMVNSTYISKELIYQSLQNYKSIDNNFTINPMVGWTFNKSLIISDGSNVYYLIPLLVGDPNWSKTVIDIGYRSTSSGTIRIRLKDKDLDVYIERIRGVFAKDLSHVRVYLDYEDGGSEFLGDLKLGEERTIYVNWAGYGVVTVNEGYYNVSFIVKTYSITRAKLKYEGTPEYAILKLIFGWSGEEYYKFISLNHTVYIHIDDKDICLKKHSSSETIFYDLTGPLNRYIDVPMDDDWPSRTNSAGVYLTDSFKTPSYLYVINPNSSYLKTVYIKYRSYDVVSLSNIRTSQSPYIRPSIDQRTEIQYEKYLLLGEGRYNITVRIPEMYALYISQGYPNLPQYLVLINWLSPYNVIRIDDTNDSILARYGLVNDGTNITLLYLSAMFKNNTFIGIYNKLSTIELEKGYIYTIIPLEGKYRGNVFYIWVNSWKLLKT